MQYLLMITDIPGEWDRVPPAEQARIMEGHQALGRALAAEGKRVESHRLRPVDEARTLRLLPGGDRTVVDGPFTEAKEVMGGFYVIDCASMDEALAWARRIPLTYGSIEVRPVWE